MLPTITTNWQSERNTTGQPDSLSVGLRCVVGRTGGQAAGHALIALVRGATIALLAASLIACTSSQGPQSSGKLDVTVPKTSPDRVKTALVNEMQKRKFRIAQETASQMAFEQPAGSSVLQSLSGADVGRNPIERVTYNIRQVGSDVQVSAEIAVINKTASSPEKKIDISPSAEAQQISSVLDKIAGN
jgi:hypothetical protein